MDDHEPQWGWGVNDSIPIYDGELSSIKVFDYALTVDEILAIYERSLPWYKRLWRWITAILRGKDNER